MKILWELYQAFFRIGLLTFGGGYAMLPMLKREVVDRYKWITEEEMLDIYAIGQCTPGIIAINTATYIGYKKGGVLGGIIATLGEVTPSLIIITLIASVLKNFMDLPIVLHAFVGIRIVVCALMMSSVVQMAKSGVKDRIGFVLFLATILLLLFTPVTTIMIIIMAAVAGIIISKVKEVK
ncbi:MAG: chromate transporter [Eubacteriales bacterium]